MVRVATPDELVDVVRVLEGALLQVDPDTVERRVADEAVLVAAPRGQVAGAIVAQPRERGAFVEALAVSRTRRGRGHGSTLVAAAADRWGRLTVEFEPARRTFYANLGFAVCETREGRCRGIREG